VAGNPVAALRNTGSEERRDLETSRLLYLPSLFRMINCRHTYTTLLTQNNEDVKVVQELLRQANSRITLDLYAQAGSSLMASYADDSEFDRR